MTKLKYSPNLPYLEGLEEAIIIDNISKSYADVQALKNISLRVNKGELFGLIGPDGAGKTTLIRILMTLLLPNSGNATIDGLDVVNDFKNIRSIVGYMPGQFSLYQDLSVEENLNFFATVFGTTVEENYDLISDIYCQIEPFKNRRAGKLSGGMKQKLALSCALIHKPKILVLDEPTTGVDAVSRKEFWEMLMNLKAQGITILVSTPYMDEATLCDRIALIFNGEFLQVDMPENIILQYPETLWSVTTNQMHKLLKELKNNTLVKSAYSFGESIHITINNEDAKAKLNYQLSTFNCQLKKIQPTIEDCFMLLSKHQTKP